jgi:hypothetical protein
MPTTGHMVDSVILGSVLVLIKSYLRYVLINTLEPLSRPSLNDKKDNWRVTQLKRLIIDGSLIDKKDAQGALSWQEGQLASL